MNFTYQSHTEWIWRTDISATPISESLDSSLEGSLRSAADIQYLYKESVNNCKFHLRKLPLKKR
uniref:Uncharacterized protein n=1 Tax=Arundo donax TaxID=35708 RepID=A0A0A9AGP5_ARUDO